MERLRGNLPLIFVWLATCALLIIFSWSQISTGIGWGPDDQLRHVQLRDWLGGQSWFDTVQYRIGEPDSQPMHWPRLIEIPLALIILLMSPLLGSAAAETMAMVVVPLITLAIAMILIKNVTEQIFDSKIALLAAALTATAIPAIIQLRPMRIDHHGWQIVLALLALSTMFWPDKRKGGIVLGATLALWLAISLEGLPLSVAFIALLVWRWVIDGNQSIRLFWALVSFAIVSLLLFLLSHGSFEKARSFCDAIGPAHLFACFSGGTVMLVAIKFASQNLFLRLGGLILAGVTALAALYSFAPQCLGGAFGTMAPLVREYWFINVKEGLPVWHQPWKTTATLLGGSIFVALFSLPYLLNKAVEGCDREKLFLLAYGFFWAFIVSLLVQRATAVAAVFALPLMAWTVHQIFVRARQIRRPVSRIVATASVILIIMPGALAVALYNGISGESKARPSEIPVTLDGQIACDSAVSLEHLNALPKSNIATPFDLGPVILLKTSHNVLATSHHRNDRAMADQIRLFTSDFEAAREILEARNIGYIATCPDEAELNGYIKLHPQGLWGRLANDQKPEWLLPVHFRDSDLLVWRVVPKELGK